MYARLNAEQKVVVDAVLGALHGRLPNSRTCHFIDGPGGSGKTFVYKTIYHLAVAAKKNILNIAWTGIAAALLPDGKTVSSAFQLSILDHTSTLKNQDKKAQELRKVDAVIWDEAPMAPKKALEAIDEKLKDLMGNQAP
ncbi:unnamed protein product, partial [Mesorhabditis spiculigera]